MGHFCENTCPVCGYEHGEVMKNDGPELYWFQCERCFLSTPERESCSEVFNDLARLDLAYSGERAKAAKKKPDNESASVRLDGRADSVDIGDTKSADTTNTRCPACGLTHVIHKTVSKRYCGCGVTIWSRDFKWIVCVGDLKLSFGDRYNG